jgi:glycosyltransferase involved in cell wall biosynthesis
MKNNFISIIVPCFNQAEYLDECLESVLSQTFQDWECIIVNDGSTDNTSEISKNWLKKDNRFKYIFQENAGLSATRNKGIENAIGEFILPLDADDKISSEYCRLAIEEFSNNKDLKVVYCQAEKFGEETGEWILETFSLNRLAIINLIFCSAIYRKTDWQKVGGYDDKMIYGFEDWEFWIAILKNGGLVKRIHEIGFFYRIKQVSMVTSLNDEKRKFAFEYLSVKHADFFVGQLGSFYSLNSRIKKLELQSYKKIKSPKVAIDLFCKTFFRFTIFKTLNQN